MVSFSISNQRNQSPDSIGLTDTNLNKFTLIPLPVVTWQGCYIKLLIYCLKTGRLLNYGYVKNRCDVVTYFFQKKIQIWKINHSTNEKRMEQSLLRQEVIMELNLLLQHRKMEP